MSDPQGGQTSGMRVQSDIARRFEQAVLFIAAGLCEKDELYDVACAGGVGTHTYPYSPAFRHGLNMFVALCVECCDHPALTLHGMSESSFIRNYATRDVCQWVCDWRPEAAEALSGAGLLDAGPLVEMDGNFFCPTQGCHEVLRFAEADLLGAFQERKVYEFLRDGTQAQYVLGRRLLVRYPILSWDDQARLKTWRFDFSADPLDQGEGAAVDHDWVEALIDLAYEAAPSQTKVCPSCGWTMSKCGRQPRCIACACASGLPADFSALPDVPRGACRLRKGVMRYICAPGRLELGIAQAARDLGLKFELWPEKDSADVMVTACDGRRIAVDAKAYGRAERLAREILDDFGLARLEPDEAFYVIPDSVERQSPGYRQICEAALKARSNYSCCTYGEFLKYLRGLKDAERP